MFIRLMRIQRCRVASVAQVTGGDPTRYSVSTIDRRDLKEKSNTIGCSMKHL